MMSKHEVIAAADRLARVLLPDEDIRERRALRILMQSDGSLNPGTIRFPWQIVQFRIGGAVTAGTNRAEEIRIPTRSKIMRLDALLKTAPSSQVRFRLTANGAPIPNAAVTVQPGQNAGASGVNAYVEPGDVLRIDVLSAGGSDATIIVAYIPDDGS